MILTAGRIVANGTAGELAEQIVGKDEVRWTRDGQPYAHATSDPTAFAFDLFTRYGEAVSDLDIRRSSLEDTYLTLVRHAESGKNDAVAHALEGADR